MPICPEHRRKSPERTAGAKWKRSYIACIGAGITRSDFFIEELLRAALYAAAPAGGRGAEASEMR
jgi:hypothetical protein